LDRVIVLDAHPDHVAWAKEKIAAQAKEKIAAGGA